MLVAGGAFLVVPRNNERPVDPAIVVPPVSVPSSNVTAQAESDSKPTSVKLAKGFVGTAECARCHAEQHESYLATHHSRSLTKVDAATSEKPGEFYHAISHTKFEASIADGRLWHSQSLQLSPSAGPEERFVIDHLPVKYVIGSGSFAKGYLLEDQEFLVQSPVTWYAKPQHYAIAPGYDVPAHLGTTRLIADHCLFCHVNSLARKDGNDEKLVVTGDAIGCERCHGAGEQHAALFSSLTDLDDRPEDPRIANPGKLDRFAAESICAQCHLQGDAIVDAAGKSGWDFKPGERLDATRVDYKAENAGPDRKAFVDHFDQLWHSACYLNTSTLTCITCHDPHHAPTGETVEQIQIENCLKCHEDQSCSLELNVRVEREQNRCYRCHMPRTGSGVPHAATTNHRIGIYPGDSAEPPPTKSDHATTTLRRLVSPLDPRRDESSARDDAMADALWSLQDSPNYLPEAELGDAALEALLAIAPAAPDDAELHASIARLAKRKADSLTPSAMNREAIDEAWRVAERHAFRVLELEPNPNLKHKHALRVLSATFFERGDFARAAQCGVELGTSGRSAKDWYNFGLALGRMQQFAEAEQAFRMAIRLDARYEPPYRSLFTLYSALNPAMADQVRRAALQLEHLKPSE
jgi:predicted CXXCH cytochrome family protein